jgi:hypothetical protein
MPQITTFRSNLISKGYDVVAGAPLVFPGSTSRDYFMVTNLDAAKDIEVAFGKNPVAADFFKISAGGFFEPAFTPTGDITIKSVSATTSVVVLTDAHNSV